MKEVFGKPAKSPDNMETILRSEYQGSLNHHVRKIKENFTEKLTKTKQDFDMKLTVLKEACMSSRNGNVWIL